MQKDTPLPGFELLFIGKPHVCRATEKQPARARRAGQVYSTNESRKQGVFRRMRRVFVDNFLLGSERTRSAADNKRILSNAKIMRGPKRFSFGKDILTLWSWGYSLLRCVFQRSALKVHHTQQGVTSVVPLRSRSVPAPYSRLPKAPKGATQPSPDRKVGESEEYDGEPRRVRHKGAKRGGDTIVKLRTKPRTPGLLH